jgi:hypothetical protein
MLTSKPLLAWLSQEGAVAKRGLVGYRPGLGGVLLRMVPDAKVFQHNLPAILPGILERQIQVCEFA